MTIRAGIETGALKRHARRRDVHEPRRQTQAQMRNVLHLDSVLSHRSQWQMPGDGWYWCLPPGIPNIHVLSTMGVDGKRKSLSCKGKER